MKHTPGPWQLMNGSIVGKSPELRVCMITSAMKDKAVTNADARLIAAAPELLAALHQIIVHADQGGLNANSSSIDVARALLARLT